MSSPFHCPSCQQIVYNRRLAACEFCGKELPAAIRLTPAEVAARDQRLDEWMEDSATRNPDPTPAIDTAAGAGYLAAVVIAGV